MSLPENDYQILKLTDNFYNAKMSVAQMPFLSKMPDYSRIVEKRFIFNE